jgi:hypothetical protein
MGILSTVLVLVAASLHATASNIPTISTKGSKFFISDGNQFFVKGKRRLSITYWNNIAPSQPIIIPKNPKISLSSNVGLISSF